VHVASWMISGVRRLIRTLPGSNRQLVPRSCKRPESLLCMNRYGGMGGSDIAPIRRQSCSIGVGRTATGEQVGTHLLAAHASTQWNCRHPA
jgi:hypothetical protein